MEFRHLGKSASKSPLLSLATGTFGGRRRILQGLGRGGVPSHPHGRSTCLDAASPCSDSADIYSSGRPRNRWRQAIKGRRDQGDAISTQGHLRSDPSPNSVGSSRFHLTPRPSKAASAAWAPTSSTSSNSTPSRAPHPH